MTLPRRVLVGEGTAEPTAGLQLALTRFAPDPVQFLFGVRRTSEGLAAIDQEGVTIATSFPGRGLSRPDRPLQACALSAYQTQRLLASGRLRADALVVVATLPGHDGTRSLGTVNGYMQAAVDAARFLVIEEAADLPVIPGAAAIPAHAPAQVIGHVPAPYRALSRAPDDVDAACAQQASRLVDHGVCVQLGVGGAIEAMGTALAARRGLQVITGAVGAAVQALHRQGCLRQGIDVLGSALVGDAGVVEWARASGRVRLAPSSLVHNPAWLARHERFHAINAVHSVDLDGNANAEWAGERRVSGRGGASDFARGAIRSPGGASIVLLRADRPGCLVSRLSRPSIPARHVSFVVCERGVADLRGRLPGERAALIEKLLA